METPEQAYEQYVWRAHEQYVWRAHEQYVHALIEAGYDAQSNHDLVSPDRACTCGERRMDWLIWTEDAINVKCATCGLVFRPGGGR